MPIAPWAICRRPCATISCGSAGAMATTRSCRRSRWSRWFDLDAIGRSAARFDFAKLENLNGHYLSATPDAGDHAAPARHSLPELPNGGELAAKLDADGWGKLAARAAWPEGARQDSGRDCWTAPAISLPSGRSRSTRKAEKLLDAGGRAARLRLFCRGSRRSSLGRAEALDAAVRAYAEEAGLKLGKVAQPLRAALTGRSTSPGIFDVLEPCLAARRPWRASAIRPASPNLHTVLCGTLCAATHFSLHLCRSAKKI